MVELRPRRTKAAAPEAAQVEETPKSKPKTPKGSKRKAIDDVSPAATKKTKSVKTPAKSKDTVQPAKEETEPTPKSKKTKTPSKAKEAEDVTPKDSEKTPVSKSKKDKTPATPKEVEKTPASKSKKEKTPAKPEVADKTPVSKPKKEKTPAKPKDTEGATPKDSEKTPATKSKKEKTPAKAKLAKDTPSKVVEQAAPEKTPTQTKETPKKAAEQTPLPKDKDEKTPKKTPKSSKKSAKKAEPEPEPELVEQEDAVEEAEDIFSEEELDEQTKALVQTIDNGDEDEPGSGVVLFTEGQDVGVIPEATKKEKKAAKKALAALKEKEDTGVIYVGRLPHGFYEHEMRSYFSQFGPIRNLRVSRNKHTGKAKHFGFIEFEELSTAEIVAKTMDNYLLFGHILKCSVIPKAQVNAQLFKGANKRFKPVPWNKMESRNMERPMLEDKWARRINKENKRRADRAKKLQSLGYEFSAPEVKPVDAAKAIAAQDAVEEAVTEAITEAVTEAAEEPTKAIEAPPAAEAVEDAPKEQEMTPQPVKRGRGRPAKTPQKATETPRKTSRRTKA